MNYQVLPRDQAYFISYSPKFGNGYVTELKGKVLSVFELVEPKSETVQLKIITGGAYTAIGGLLDPINRVIGDIELGKLTKTISVADFGFTQLRKGIYSRDGESVIKSLHSVNFNLDKFKTELAAQGLTEELTAKFSTAATIITEGKQKQYEILVARKVMVQDNMEICNDLYDQLSEIFAIGKILYKATNPLRLKEYSFTDLMKSVRKISTGTSESADTSKIAVPVS